MRRSTRRRRDKPEIHTTSARDAPTTRPRSQAAERSLLALAAGQPYAAPPAAGPSCLVPNFQSQKRPRSDGPSADSGAGGAEKEPRASGLAKKRPAGATDLRLELLRKWSTFGRNTGFSHGGGLADAV